MCYCNRCGKEILKSDWDSANKKAPKNPLKCYNCALEARRKGQAITCLKLIVRIRVEDKQ